ncbi:hypothetical protein WSS_A15729 [Rhodococcus opacus M213]|uniref:Uncharacterized protein n=1 Tax=Rhodococcus opacus M213 TaxID=1129896 RepID=K8XJD9_RHOOP|nr:hypothetical protein [Rhodococcus opacus]EKT81733.1 hypothetical protein WSS_A15729 [Rhodococcus opacus M213]
MTHRSNVPSTTDTALRVNDPTAAEVAALAELCLNKLEEWPADADDPETGSEIDIDGAIRAAASRPDPRA